MLIKNSLLWYRVQNSLLCSSWQNLEWRTAQNAESVTHTDVHDVCLQLQTSQNHLNVPVLWGHEKHYSAFTGEEIHMVKN